MMKLHASGEDYLEAILVLHKKMGTVGTLRGCCPAHGGIEAQRVSCGGYAEKGRLSAHGRGSLPAPDRPWP